MPVFLQAQTVTWQKEYPDSTSFFSDGYSAVQLEDEGYIIVSARSSSSLGIVVMRLDKFGNMIWRKYYLGTNPRTIVKTDDGNFLIGANTLNKIDLYGTLIWSRSNSPSYRINLTKDGGFFYCGSFGLGLNTVPSIKKYDSLGFIEWEVLYGKQFYKGGFSNCIINKNNQLILIGNYGLYDYPLIVKTDLLGNITWYHIFQTDSLRYFYLNNIKENANGEYLSSGSNYHCYLVKFSNEGTWVWTKYFDFPGTLTSLEPTKDHGFAFGGYYKLNDTTDRVRLLKTDYDGNEEWVKYFGRGHYTSSNFVAQTNDNGFIITGRRDTFANAVTYVIKTDVNGNTSPWVQINTISETLPQKFILYQNYPNPFNPNTKIYFDIMEKSYTVLTVYNSLGKEITVLLSQNLNPGKYSVDFNSNDFGNLLPSGIYFYSLKTDNFSESKKMLLIK